MKSALITALAVIVLFVLQSLPAHRLVESPLSISWLRVQADIAVIFVIYLGVREQSLLRGTLLAFAVGLFADSFAPAFLRLHLFIAPLLFITTFAINIRFYFMKLESYILLVFVLSLLVDHLCFFIMGSIAPWHTTFYHLFWMSLKQSLLDALFGAVVFIFFDWLKDNQRHVYQNRI